jgi:nucleotide-binding universal stress UspA family protein
MPVNLRSILSPVDFSEQSRHAFRWAGAFATRFQSRLTVVNVVDPLLTEVARLRLGQNLAKAEAEPALREFVAAAWPDGTEGRVQTAFRTPIGDPATAILETAAADAADLIVMGTQGLSGFQKWLLGSTTERVLRRTHVPVLVVPHAKDSQAASAGEGRVSRILAATDFSDASAAAVTMAAELAREFSAQITLAYVVHPLIAAPQWQALLDASEETRVGEARAKLRSLAEQICSAQGYDDVVVVGRPAEAIGSIAGDRRAEMIVMGLASDQGPFASRPGSIAYRVLCSTTVPVLVVPAVRHDTRAS